MGQRIGGAGRWRRLGHRLLHSRARTWSLVVLTVLCTAAAILIGLPPQSDLPTGFGRIIAIPVLPETNDARPYTVRIAWHALNFSRTGVFLFSDTYWTEPGPRDSAAGLPVYLAIDDDETAKVVLGCSDGQSGSPVIHQVAALPKPQHDLYETYMKDVSGGSPGGMTFLRIDDLATEASPGFSFASCQVPTETVFTKDDVELHLHAPAITVVTPRPEGARERDGTAPYVVVTLPVGWSPQDARASQGRRTDIEAGVSWSGVEPVEPLTGRTAHPDAPYRALEVGPVSMEASSLNAARRADRRLFWSGLLVGLAGSCLLMLFESLPWRREERAEG